MGKQPVRGVLFFRRNGRASVRVEGREEPIPLAKGASGTALHGDEVLLRRLPPKKKKTSRKQPGRKPSKPRYEVSKILKRGTDEFLGFLRRSSNGKKQVFPENSRLPLPFKVTGDESDARHGDKVLAKFHRWDGPAPLPSCRILRALGPAGEPMTDHLGILAAYGLSSTFPDKVLQEAAQTPDQVRPKDRKGRRDFRKTFTLTIDPLDARDFDDALSLRTLPEGTLEIGVHIADVSAYVPPDSALDKEARRRGNSTYLVGEVVPMLPENLSNGVCSLVEGEERLVKSVIFRFGKGAKLLKTEFAEGVILSDKRLTYEQAGLLLDEKRDLATIRAAKPPESRYSGNPGKALADLPDSVLRQLRATIRSLWKIASVLRKRRIKDGSLNLDSPEVKILVDAKGRPERILQAQSDDSHHLIEEFMLLANESTAKEFRKRKLHAIHRVHPEPDPQNLDELRHFVSLFGISCGDLNHRRETNKLLDAIRRHPLAQVLRIKFLRSLKQACYRASPDGHYGLAKKDYLHFTSPIRRYADLVVHRILARLLHKERRPAPHLDKLEATAKHLSVTERNSVDAERESVKTKLVAYYDQDLQANSPRTHEAVITEIARKGFFIELPDTLARGFVPLRSLPRDEGWRVNANQTAVTPRHSREPLRLGQTVFVLIDRINHAEKLLDFRLA